MFIRYGVLSLIGILLVAVVLGAFDGNTRFYSDQQVLIKTINYTKQRNIEIEFQVAKDKQTYVDGINVQPYQNGYLVKFVKCSIASVCSSQYKAIAGSVGVYRVQFEQDRRLWIRERRGELQVSPRIILPPANNDANQVNKSDYL